MPRPLALLTACFLDWPLDDVARKANEWGYRALELACWGDHLDVQRAASDEAYCAERRDLLERYDLELVALAAHPVSQAVLDRVDQRHRALLPDHVWGDGDPAGVSERAAAELQATAKAAQQLGAPIVSGLCGSPLPPLAFPFQQFDLSLQQAAFREFAERFNPILDAFSECGVQFALTPHPCGVAFDLDTAEQTLAAVDRREELGFCLNPQHLAWQGLDPTEMLRALQRRIYHVHLADLALKLNGRTSVLDGTLPPGDPRRGWDSRSLGRGGVDFEEFIRAANDINYNGPLVVVCDDPQMDRDASAKESCQFLQNLDFTPQTAAADAKTAGR